MSDRKNSPELRSYTPTLSERLVAALQGDTMPSSERRRFAEGVATILGVTPVIGNALALDTAVRHGNVQDAMMAVIPGAPSVKMMTATTQSAMVQASKNARIFAFPNEPQRPFHADYAPTSKIASVATPGTSGERLAVTMDGHPLVAELVAGRRLVGGGDEGLAAESIDRLARRLVGDVRPAVAGEIGNDAGRYMRVAGEDGPQRSILYSPALLELDRSKVIAHEIGHAVDDLGGLSLEGYKKHAAQNYNSGTNPNRGPKVGEDLGDARATAKSEAPKHHGYTKALDSDAELKAEAFRGYLTNPNYFKSRFPQLAAAMRESVNSNPRVNKFIQLNSLVPAVAAGTTGAATYERTYTKGPKTGTTETVRKPQS